MSKPIIFFSHSSHDEKIIRKLKDSLIHKTSNTVDIFASSDGQSIPLGHNWIHRVEQALISSKLMLIFLSPSSLHSHWIYFEAGFAYSKGIEVVPVGILGVDLFQLSPPLSLLQGFNIKSADGLNNIIALFNRLFSHSHEESFVELEYNELFEIYRAPEKGGLGEYAALIDEIQIIGATYSRGLSLGQIAERLKSKDIEYQITTKNIYTYGLSFTLAVNNEGVCSLDINLDPNLTGITFPILDDALQAKDYSIKIVFSPIVNYFQQHHKMTAKIYKTEIKIGLENYLVYGDIEFKIDHSIDYVMRGNFGGTNACLITYLEIKYQGISLANMKLFELLKLLFECEVLYFDKATPQRISPRR